MNAWKCKKLGKAPGVDGCVFEMLKKGGVAVEDWLLRLFNACWEQGQVPLEWKSALIVPLYKGKGDKQECGSYRGISMLSVVGKTYGKILIKKVRLLTENLIGEEQCGFRKGRGCVDQVFVIRQVCEKFLSAGKAVFFAFMDLEKAYDRVDRKALWEVLRMYGVGSKLLAGVKSFYDGSRACVRVSGSESEWFGVKVGLRQGCVMSPWLFNVFIDGVVREVKSRLENGGASMVGEDGSIWKLCQLLFADDTVLVADSEFKLRQLILEFCRACEKRKLRVNIDKSKVLKCSRAGLIGELAIGINGELIEEVENFKYLGSQISVKGGTERDVNCRLNEASKCLGGLKSVLKNRYLGMESKKRLYESVIVPTVLYGAETWCLRETERKKLNVFEMKCLRGMTGLYLRDRIRNEEIRRRIGVRKTMAEMADVRVLGWFGHMVRMGEDRVTKRVWNSKVSGTRPRGRPTMTWVDGVKKALVKRELSLCVGTERGLDRAGWRKIVRA